MKTSKVLVIGLDGVPFELLNGLFAKGIMPFLQSMDQEGYHANLLSTVPPISAPAWTTFATGVNPGQHGILQFVNLRPGKAADAHETLWMFPGGVSLLNADKIRGVTLWQLLSDAGQYPVIVNVPLTYPPRAINGIMVTGMLTPPNARTFTHPPELSERLRRAGYETDLPTHEREFDFDPERFVSRLGEVLRKRREICLQLMEGEPWKFFMVVFTGTDRMLHRFWKYLVPGSPEYASPEATDLRPHLESYFRELDRTIADLVHLAGTDTATIVLSDHGFGPVPDHMVHALSMMQALGVAGRWTKSPIVRFRKFAEGYLGLTPSQIRRWARAIMPEEWAARLDARLRNAQLSAGAASLAYSVTLHTYVGGIYINRERFSDETAYADFRQRLVSGLKNLQDPSSRTPLMQEVYLREELYSGSALAECPDIVFYLTSGYQLSGGIGPKGKLVSSRRRDPNEQGIHQDEGILILRGPGVKAERASLEKLQDVTATILYLLDEPIPSAMDSRPILRALEPDFVRQRPPRYTDTPLDGLPPDGGAGPGMSQEDQEELVERLRGLGYIE